MRWVGCMGRPTSANLDPTVARRTTSALKLIDGGA